MATIAPSVVAGRYRLLRLLGCGGMGDVWLAHDQRFEREVAVKLPRDRSAFSGREMEAARRVEHPNIVPLLDCGWDGDAPFLVFAYIEAPTLRQALDERGAMPAAHVITVGRQLASALAHAHGAGVLHNDIKPENILLLQGRALLADFGAAVGLDTTLSVARAGELSGTIAYLAPEVLAGARPSVASDLYSLALVLYEGAAGILPRQGSAGGDFSARRLSAAPPSLRDTNPAIPARLDAALLQALSPLPSLRPPSATAFRDALSTGSQATERIQRPQPVPAEGHTAPSRRGAWMLGGVVAVAVALAAGGTFALAHGGGRGDTPPVATPNVSVQTTTVAGGAGAHATPATPTATPTVARPTPTAVPPTPTVSGGAKAPTPGSGRNEPPSRGPKPGRGGHGRD